MKNIAYKLLGILFILATIGCETVYTEPVANLGEIAVISSVGQEFTVAGVGTTVFQNTNSSASDITAWDLDRFIAEEIVRLLSPNYSVQIESVDPEEFVAPEVEQGIDFFSGKEKYNLSEALQGYASSQDADKPQSYLVILPATRPGDARFRSAPNLRGPGLFFEGFLGLKNTVVYIGADVALHNGETFEEERRLDLRVKPEVVDGKARGTFYQFVSNELAVRSFDELNDEQRLQIKTELEKLIKAALLKTLTDLGFILAPDEALAPVN